MEKYIYFTLLYFTLHAYLKKPTLWNFYDICHRLKDINESILFLLALLYHSARFLKANIRLLHAQNIVKWAVMKRNPCRFLHQKAKMHSFLPKLILDISEEY